MSRKWQTKKEMLQFSSKFPKSGIPPLHTAGRSTAEGRPNWMTGRRQIYAISKHLWNTGCKIWKLKDCQNNSRCKMAKLNHNQTEGFHSINTVTEHFQCMASWYCLANNLCCLASSLFQACHYCYARLRITCIGIARGCRGCSCTPGREIKILGAEFTG